MTAPSPSPDARNGMPAPTLNVVYVIWDAGNRRCATIDCMGTSGVFDVFNHVSLLVRAYDEQFPDAAPHVAFRYEHKPAPVVQALYRIPNG